MRLFDAMILVLGIIGSLSWAVFSGKDGFKGGNAMIVARSISIASTIDGQIDNNPPAVGTRVSPDELLVRVFDRRIDRSRLTDFESEINYLEREIKNMTQQQVQILALLEKFESRANSYAVWKRRDIELRNVEQIQQLEVAKKHSQLKLDEVSRAAQLFDQQQTSSVNLKIAKTESEIARNKVGLSQAKVERSELMLRAFERDGVFFENGDTSYWEKEVDSLKARYLDNLTQISTLNARLIRARAQAEVESARIGSNYSEEHRAPFRGMVNATFVIKGTRVTSGTSLLEVLDCANPVVIVPIPEHRMSEFSTGMDVTVYPIDSDQVLTGKIKYISSGPLIGHDTSLQVQENLTLGGMRAIVSLDVQSSQNKSSQSCEAARKAIAVIHTESLYSSVSEWVSAYLSIFLPDAEAQTASAG